jgi:hypothetical protein
VVSPPASSLSLSTGLSTTADSPIIDRKSIACLMEDNARRPSELHYSEVHKLEL